MSCILRITDPILSKILGSEFKTVQELREKFNQLADESIALPVNIQSREETFARRKFAKFYKEDDQIKVQIVMPGQENFMENRTGLPNLPEQLKEPSFYGEYDAKVLTFDSIDSFMGFYFANYLYVNELTLPKLIDAVEGIVKNTIKRLQGKGLASYAIEDIKFADSLVSYFKLLYNLASIKESPVINEFYELVKQKIDTWHHQAGEDKKVQTKNKKADKVEAENNPANVFFETYNYTTEPSTKPLALARENLVRAIDIPSEYQVRMVQGSIEFAQETDLTKEQIEAGVVGVLYKGDKQVYLGLDNKLTTNPEESQWFEYTVEGKKMKSPVLHLLLSNTQYGKLKQRVRDGEEIILQVQNPKVEKIFSDKKPFKEAFEVSEIVINTDKGSSMAGRTYIEMPKGNIFVDSTVLNPEETEEVVKLLEHEYEDSNTLKDIVTYLNNLISVSQERVEFESTGREISFWEGEGRIEAMPERIKVEDTFLTIEPKRILIEENKSLVLQSLNAARIRFRKKEKSNKVQTSWTKWEIQDGQPVQSLVRDKEGKEFYESHIKDIYTQVHEKVQLATFTEKLLPTKEETDKIRIKEFVFERDKVYQLEDIDSLFTSITSPELNDTSNILKEKETQKNLWNALRTTEANPKIVFTEYPQEAPAYYEPKTDTIYLKITTIREKPSNLKIALTEELFHAVTIPKLKTQQGTKEYKKLLEDYERAKELKKTYKETKEYQDLTDIQKRDLDRLSDYYLQSLEEFVVGISNPHFRSFLRLGEGKNLLESILKSLKVLFQKILGDVAPSLYTDVVADVLEFSVPTFSSIEVVDENLTADSVLEPKPIEQKKERPKREKRKVGELDRYFAPPIKGDVDPVIIQGLDAELSQVLFNEGRFGNFVQGRVYTEEVWNRYYNQLIDEETSGVDEQRQAWIDNFMENESLYKKEWMTNSKLFKFNNDKLTIEEDELDREEEEETAEGIQGKDPGFNKVDTEQKYSRLQLADKYAKIFVRLTPQGRVNGLTQLSDFTTLWNKLQNELKGTLSVEEQIDILKFEEVQNRIPQAKIIVERLEALPADTLNNQILNSFQSSFSTAEVPVWIPFFTLVKNEKGETQYVKWSFFEQGRLDIQNLELITNSNFIRLNKFKSTYNQTTPEGVIEIPTYDNKQIIQFLKQPKPILDIYRELGFPIPELTKEQEALFLRDSELKSFNSSLISLLNQRANKSYILNGDFIGYIKQTKTWLENGTQINIQGLSTQLNTFLSTLSRHSLTTVSNMTRNAEGQNQSILLSWSSWLIGVKELNEGVSYRSKNPIFKYSLIAQQVSESNPVRPVNLNGSRYVDDNLYEGNVSLELTPLQYLRQEISSFMLRGVAENLRAEAKQSSFGYFFRWRTEGDSRHPIPLESFKTDKWKADAFHIFLTNRQKTGILKGYLRGELDRIQKEINNPVVYYPKYDAIKTDFHLFTFLPETVKQDKILPFEEFYAKHESTIKKALLEDFDSEVQEFKDWVKNITGIPLTKNHPILNIPEIQKQISELGFDQFLRAYIVNRRIHQLEHFITSHGDIGQHDKPYKRFGSNISTGTPVALNTQTIETLESTLSRTYTGRLSTGRSFVTKDDVLNFEDPAFTEGVEKSIALSFAKFGIEKTESEIKTIAQEKVIPYLKTTVTDGEGFMTPDFGRTLMITTGNWTPEREDGYWYMVLEWKKMKGTPLTPEEQKHFDRVDKEVGERGIYWSFPKLKFQYRGPQEGSETNVVIEGLDKFALAWLWPQYQIGTKFEPILNQMMEEGYDYGKFESSTKIGTFPADDLLSQVESGEIIITSGHDIDLKYMKEQVKAGEGFKNKAVLSTQARKLLISNLISNGEYLTERVKEGVTKWKEIQQTLARFNKSKLKEEITTDGKIDNRKLADKVKQELNKRDLPESLQAIFLFYGTHFYDRFEQALSPQLVETLIYSLLKNEVIRDKKPGEHYPQVSSTLYDRLGQRDLNFYTYTDEEVLPAECKITLSGEFKKLLNVKEITALLPTEYEQLSNFQKLEIRRNILNQLILQEEFKTKYKRELTIYCSRIPGQGYNSMDIFMVKEFLPAWDGPIIVLPPQATKKSGTDFDFDKLPTLVPSLTGRGKLVRELSDTQIGSIYDTQLKELFQKYQVGKLDNLKMLVEFDHALRDYGVDIKEIKVPIIKEGQVLSKEEFVQEYRKRQTSKVLSNKMIEAAEEILLDPINFHRLVTPNQTKDLDEAVKRTLTKLGISPVEPKFDNIFRITSHLSKWLAMKMKDPLGIAATNNTFYTLQQDAQVKVNPTFNIGELAIPTDLPFETEEQPFFYPLIGDKDKLEFINQFINITVDIAANDAVGYTNLRQENTGLLLFLVERGVSFEDAFFFINQPSIIKYHQVLDYYLDRGVSQTEAKRLTISILLGVPVTEIVEGKTRNRKKEEIYRNIFNLTVDRKFTNLESTIVPISQIPDKLTPQQKSYLAFYLIGQEMTDAQREAQAYNSVDVSVSPTYLYAEMRERGRENIQAVGLFNMEGIDKIHTDSVISEFDVRDEFKEINETAFEIRANPYFIRVATHLGLMIQGRDREKFIKTFQNDFLLAIIQNYGTISKERIEDNLKNLMNRWEELKQDEEIKDLTLTKYLIPNYSKSGLVSPSLFLGMDNDSQTYDQIAKDVRTLTQSTNPQVRKWAKDFIETGIYTTGFNVSPVYYLKALPHELVTPYLKEAYDNFQSLDELSQLEFINTFADKFRYQRGMQFAQYFLPLYKAEGVENVNGKFKRANFNQEPWRYADYTFEGGFMGFMNFINILADELLQKEFDKVDEENQPFTEYEDVTHPRLPQQTGIQFIEDPSTGYAERTKKNASADATIAIAVDFNSAGEKLTKNSVLSQGKTYIPIDVSKSLEVTDELVKRVVNQLGNSETLNIAGNGIYTMKGKYTQEHVDDFTYKLLARIKIEHGIQSIRTGGQTGFDEAGAKAGIRLGIPTLVLAPKGWKFRNIQGQDISDEKQFKLRFKEQVLATPVRQEIQVNRNEQLTKQQFKSAINSFEGINEFLSNFYQLTNPIVDEYGNKYWNSEGYYMSLRTDNLEDKKKLSKVSEESGSKVKQFKRGLKLDENESNRVQYMRQTIKAKFDANPELAQKLKATGNRLLVEGNYWKDTLFGVDDKTFKGFNALGKALMEYRDNINYFEQPIQPQQTELFKEEDWTKPCDLDVPF